jgi:tight adherence protein C
MVSTTLALRLGSLLLLALGVSGLVGTLAGVPVPPAPRLGHRGAERRRALDQGGLFATLEPLVRFVAGLAALFPLGKLRERQERELRRADYCLGLTADELIALSFLSAISLGTLAFFVAPYADASRALAMPAAAFGAILPSLQVQEIIRKRIKHVSRGLPHSIEIAAMCMGAGLDFPGALRLLAAPRAGERDPLVRELSLILEELELGRTRREALLNFAERVPTQAVRDFVNAVIQAEQKGNPLAKVIQVQGRVLNQRRSVAAEEAAARAGILMMAPMVLLLCCILLLLMGPFFVKGIGF